MKEFRKSYFNEGYKGLTIFLVSLILSFEYNYYINFSVFFICFFLLVCIRGIDKKIILSFIPILVMTFGIFFTGYFFSRSRIENNLNSISKTTVLIGDGEIGLQLSTRVLAFAGLGFLFVFTTDPRRFILSLMQQFKLPRNFAYGVMAGYNFIPIVRKEYENMVSAYRARGVKISFIMLPMLVTAVRSSENIAMAMESKGFSSDGKRTNFIKLEIRKRDYVLAICIPILVTIIVIIY